MSFGWSDFSFFFSASVSQVQLMQQIEISSSHTLLSGTPAPTTSTRPQPLLQSFLWRGWREQGAQTDGWISEEENQNRKKGTRTMGREGEGGVGDEHMNGMAWQLKTTHTSTENGQTIWNSTEWGKQSQSWKHDVIFGRDITRWWVEEGRRGGVMEGSPIKGTVHNSAVTYTSTRRQYVRAALCDMCWCRVSLWRQRRMHSMSVVTWGEAVRSSHSLPLSLCILVYRIVCFPARG